MSLIDKPFMKQLGSGVSQTVNCLRAHFKTPRKRQSALKAGDITLLINNAGIVGGKSFLELDDRMIEKAKD